MIDKNQLIADLTEIVRPYVQDLAAFGQMSEDTNFLKDLKINSANLVDVILDIEDKYEIDIDNDDMEEMMDVKSSLSIIQRKLSER